MTNMNIVCYSLCMDFGLRQNARRTEKKMWHSRLERATSRSSGLRTGKFYPLKL